MKEQDRLPNIPIGLVFLVWSLEEYLRGCTNEQRLTVMGHINDEFCPDCGDITGPFEVCHCMNDE